MTFQTFLETKYALYVNPEMKVNLTVQQVCELVEEWEKTVSANNQKACGNCKWFSGVDYSFCHFHGKLVTVADLCECHLQINPKTT